MISSADPSADIDCSSATGSDLENNNCYDFAMNRILLGILLGLAAGLLDVLLMIPMKHPDKAKAMTGAFFSRFAVGSLAANIALPIHPALAGALAGLLISIPDSVITGKYGPILSTGLIFGGLAGWAGNAWGA